MTASHPQYFIVIDSISPHSNSQLLTAIHCDEPNTGFEPRLISAHFFCPLVWLAVTMNHFIQRKNTNKKAHNLDKVPKLRAFPAFSYLSDNCFWKRTSQIIQCTPEKQRECVLHPTPPQIFCTNSVPSFKTNTIFPSRCTTAFSTAASHNCVSNSGSIPSCPFNTL